MLKYTILFAVIACVNAFTFQDLSRAEWKVFKLEHNKSYDDELEERFRFEVFNNNRFYIAKHNERYAKGEVSYQLGINQFADMTYMEFVQQMIGLNNSLRAKPEMEGVTFISPANVELPSTVDWRQQGAVTPVKNQAQCGSCWSFSSTGAMEGQHFRKTGRLVSLSEQNLMDCSRPYGNMGCHGGWMDKAFLYVQRNGGIDTEESYPYRAVDGYCRFNPQSVGTTVRNVVYVPASEQSLQEAVATVGPISVTIEVTQNFMFYKQGIYDEPNCGRNQGLHAVLVVGYGAAQNRDYWLVKNSWSIGWGEQGYIYMTRNRGNQCRIASTAMYPLV